MLAGSTSRPCLSTNRTVRAVATARPGGTVPSVASAVRIAFLPGINVSFIPAAHVIIAFAGSGVAVVVAATGAAVWAPALFQARNSDVIVRPNRKDLDFTPRLHRLRNPFAIPTVAKQLRSYSQFCARIGPHPTSNSLERTMPDSVVREREMERWPGCQT